jgi:hypothetical protein
MSEPRKILIYDERLGGTPPWQNVQATCLVNQKHSMTSIVNWLNTKCMKYQGQETVYIMAHGDAGYVQLGKEGLTEQNAYMWGSLGENYRIHHIIILACSVAAGKKGHYFGSRLAWYTNAYVTAATAKQHYFSLPFGILPTTFFDWSGTVYTWDPGGELNPGLSVP